MCIVSRYVVSVPGDLGCSADVLSIIDQQCSSKSTCEVIIPIPDIYNLRCSNEVASLFLDASYECIEGVYTST